MKHDFEEYFPLPWTIQRKGTWEHINSHNGEGLNICIMPYTDFEPKKAARQYLVQCANLMPETVAIIKDLCDAAMAADSSIRGLEMTEKVIQRAEALLAKLEGGAEDERD